MTTICVSVVAAAIQIDGLTLTMPHPARHGDLISEAYRRGLASSDRPVQPDQQGFLTSEGQFVGRWQAARIAFHSRQISQRPAGGELTTEDLW